MKEIEKKQPNGGGKRGECGTLEAKKESVSRGKEASATRSNAPDRSSKLRAEK